MPRQNIMLATKLTDAKKQMGAWKGLYAQPKFNGHRVLAYLSSVGVGLRSSEDNSRNGQLPHIVSDLLRLQYDRSKLPAGSLILDGEAYIHGRPLNEISSLVRGGDRNAETTYVIFDVKLPMAFTYREAYLRKYLSPLCKDLPNIRISPSIYYENKEPHRLDDFVVEHLAQMKAEGYEGSIFRNEDGIYEDKRSKNLIKCKLQKEATFPITACLEQFTIHDVPKDTLGAFVVEGPEGSFRISSMLCTDAARKQLWLKRNKLIKGARVRVLYNDVSSYGTPYPCVIQEVIE